MDETYKPPHPAPVDWLHYVDVRFSGVDVQLKTLQAEIDRRFDGHDTVHARERETLTAFKIETDQWRAANNEFRQQLAHERNDYVTKAEIWWMLSATALGVTTLIGLIYFIVFAVRGGHGG